MTPQEFVEFRKAFNEACEECLKGKGQEYAGNGDRLENFKSTAEWAGVTPLQAWAVFFKKHFDSIGSFLRKGQTFSSESIESRYMDARNYLDLGLALIKESPPPERWSGDKP